MIEKNTSILDLFRKRRLPVILQSEATECGIASLAMVANYHGLDIDLFTFRQRFTVSLKGATLQEIINIATKINLNSRALRVELDVFDQIETPAILHWRLDHFVVLDKVTRKGIWVHDPAVGRVFNGWEEVSKNFSGVVLELHPNPDFEPETVKENFSMSQLWGNLKGFKKVFITALILSLILQIFALAGPYLNQIIIDNAITNFDISLLKVLAIGLLLMLLFQAMTSVLRSLVFLYFSKMMNFQMVSNLFHHLIRLPIPFFEKRHIGDVISRFSSISAVTGFLSQNIITILIDGLMAITTLVMIFIYNVWLALVVLGALGLYLTLRLSLFGVLREKTHETILTKANQQTNFIESLRGVMSIRLFSNEGKRFQVWQNLFVKSINADIKLAKLNIFYRIANMFIFGIENIAVIYLAALFVINGQFTIGMIFAFLSYKNQFVGRVTTLVDQAINYKMLDLHLERISEIALSKQDRQFLEPPKNAPEIRGKLEVRNLSFRYAKSEPYVLRDISLRISAGETIAIVGTSGCGKTTLIKIMLGILEPDSGEILVDDQPISNISTESYREKVAAVMQEDRLFSGTLAENISFFDTHLDMGRLEECARRAFIHDDIKNMPMGYYSLIGDMGSALSTGQKQRIMLARALYKNPKILFLDEGTAHLDVEMERAVNKSILELGMTRIIVAHRPQTIEMAERVFRFDGNRIKPPYPSLENITIF